MFYINADVLRESIHSESVNKVSYKNLLLYKLISFYKEVKEDIYRYAHDHLVDIIFVFMP